MRISIIFAFPSRRRRKTRRTAPDGIGVYCFPHEALTTKAQRNYQGLRNRIISRRIAYSCLLSFRWRKKKKNERQAHFLDTSQTAVGNAVTRDRIQSFFRDLSREFCTCYSLRYDRFCLFKHFRSLKVLSESQESINPRG